MRRWEEMKVGAGKKELDYGTSFQTSCRNNYDVYVV